jgi:hypothetical protein
MRTSWTIPLKFLSWVRPTLTTHDLKTFIKVLYTRGHQIRVMWCLCKPSVQSPSLCCYKPQLTIHNMMLVMKIITTLALGSQPRQGFTKVRTKNEHGSHISCSWECKKVWGNEPPQSQVSSHFGSWNPNGLLNL